MNRSATLANSLASIVAQCRLCLVTGKGGVGKTTIAGCLAIELAKTKTREKILLVSADPAHSLSELFREELDQQHREATDDKSGVIFSTRMVLHQLPNLQIQELDFTRLMHSFQAEYGSDIQSLVEEGSYLTNADIEAFIDLSMPALGELMALMEIADLVNQGEFANIVIDAASTGHTLRQLELPAFLEQLAALLALLSQRHSIVVSGLTHKNVVESSKSIVTNLASRAQVLSSQLKDPAITGAIVVSLAEGLPIEQTEDLIKELHQISISVKALLVDKVAQPACPFCRDRAQSQKHYMLSLAKTFPHLPIFTAQLCETEPSTVSELATLASKIIPLESFIPSLPTERRSDLLITVNAHMPDFAAQGKKLVIFAGKGGVGKTTLGAASALALAKRHSTLRVLIASVDPAHTLGRILETQLTDAPQQIINRLSAVEIDAKHLMVDFRELYREETGDVLQTLLQGAGTPRRGISMSLDREIADAMLNLETPDLDEFLVFRRLTQLKRTGQFDVIFIDPAPAGHLMRFLQLPAIAGNWITAFLKVISQHHAFENTQKTVTELMSSLKDIRAFEAEIRNPANSTLMMVSTPQQVVMAGTLAMVEELRTEGIPCDKLVVNMLRPDNQDCAFCHRSHKDQTHILESLSSKISPGAVITVSQANAEMKGISSLLKLGEALYG